MNMPKQKHNSEQMNWRCSPALKQRILESAKRQDISLTDWMRRAAEDSLNKEAISCRGISEPLSIYVSAKDVAWLLQALQLPEIRKEIRSIVQEKPEDRS